MTNTPSKYEISLNSFRFTLKQQLLKHAKDQLANYNDNF